MFPVKPASFTLWRPELLSDALDVLGEQEDARVLAGGQSLLPMMNLRLARPAHLIDISRLRELERAVLADHEIHVGALVRHQQLMTDAFLSLRFPLLAHAAAQVGYPAIRHHGTLGGTLAHADPAAELPAIMCLLEATVHAQARNGHARRIPAEEFFVSAYRTVLSDDELVTWVSLPLPQAAAAGWGFKEYTPVGGGFPLAGAAALARLDARGLFADVRAMWFGVGPRPIRVPVIDQLRGEDPNTVAWEDLAVRAARDLEPPDDPEYRRDLAAAALRSAVDQAVLRVRGQG